MIEMADDPRAVEVRHRGVVMPWECDDMGHMNIRFHVARYGQALRHAAASGVPFAQAGSRRIADRFVFLKEARVGARVACSLSVPQETTEVTTISGCLRDMSSDDVLARFDTLFSVRNENYLADKKITNMAWRNAAMEREWMSAMGALPGPLDDAFGMAEAVTAAVSDANAIAVLDLARGSACRMDESPVGFVVAELVLAYPPARTAGARAFSARTALLARSRRSMTFRHVIGAPGDGPDIATVRSVCVFFNRDTRQAVPVPFEP